MMIFQHTFERVMNGTKTQTRRLHQTGDTFIEDGFLNIKSVFRNRRKKWKVGDFYAVQKGRGLSAIAYIQITAIRRERLQDMSQEGAIAEGIVLDKRLYDKPREQYSVLWNSINLKKGFGWGVNPLVWVLEFELVKGRE